MYQLNLSQVKSNSLKRTLCLVGALFLGIAGVSTVQAKSPKTVGYSAETQETERKVIEVMAKAQIDLMKNSLDNVEAGKKGVPEWYMLSAAGFGYQKVFQNEVEYMDKWFDNKVGDDTHSISLVNGVDSWFDHPIANKDSIKVALNRIGKQMNTEEDVLFMAITSHGKVDSLQFKNIVVDIQNVDAKWLRETLDDSGIKWRVLVISACHSGSFIDDLITPETLIITAAREDRVSFGCGNDSVYTYFGRAFFINGLDNNDSFENVFNSAKSEVDERETEMGYRPSLPQVEMGEEMEKKLPEFEQVLFHASNSPSTVDALPSDASTSMPVVPLIEETPNLKMITE